MRPPRCSTTRTVWPNAGWATLRIKLTSTPTPARPLTVTRTLITTATEAPRPCPTLTRARTLTSTPSRTPRVPFDKNDLEFCGAGLQRWLNVMMMMMMWLKRFQTLQPSPSWWFDSSVWKLLKDVCSLVFLLDVWWSSLAFDVRDVYNFTVIFRGCGFSRKWPFILSHGRRLDV